MRKNIYIIIGEGQSGKSSLVRALTGIYRNSTREVQLANNTKINIAIWSQSAQEGTMVTPEMLLQLINDALADNALIVLRPIDAIDYINLISVQHNIIEVLFIGWGEEVQQFPTPGNINVINLSWDRPVNANAALVRNWWGWI